MDTIKKIATIFDIDGTLVETAGFEDELYVALVRDVLGDVRIREDWRTYRHVTDIGVLRQVMEENQIHDERRIQEVRAKFGETVSQYLSDGGECLPINGAIGLVDILLSSNQYAMGIATGGWGHTARMKLNHAGFNLQDVVLTSSDDSEKRITIMRKCLHALGDSYHRIVYVGDAEWDVQATRELGWHFVGVGKRLKGKCEHWIEDFSRTDTFIKMLHA